MLSMGLIYDKHHQGAIYPLEQRFSAGEIHGRKGTAALQNASHAVTRLYRIITQTHLALSDGLYDLVARAALFCGFSLRPALYCADRLQRFSTSPGGYGESLGWAGKLSDLFPLLLLQSTSH